jgi:serine/threonine protein phosphatase PrpC
LQDVAVVQQGDAFASGISLYAVADGHNGKAAARHTSLMLPMELDQQLGGGPTSDAAVLQALARTFVATDDAICRHFFQSGEQGMACSGWLAPAPACTRAGAGLSAVAHCHAPPCLNPPGLLPAHLAAGCTLTAAVVSGDTLTVANVGDSMAILDTGAEVVELTAGEH